MHCDKRVVTDAGLFVDTHNFDDEAAEKRLRLCCRWRFDRVGKLTGTGKCGKKKWLYVLVYVDKQKLYKEKVQDGSLDVEDCGEILLSGYGEEPPSRVVDKIKKFAARLTDLRLIRERDNSWHYVLVDEDKRLMFEKQFNTDSVEELKNCVTVLYTGWGQDPPDSISDKVIATYVKDSVSLELCNKHHYLLHDLARNGKVEGMRQVIDKGFDVNGTDENGWTPLHHAALSGKIEIVKLLTDKGANIHAKDKTCERKPIHIAAREGEESIITFFLNRDMEVADADRNGWMPLHYASWNGNIGAVKLLVEKGSDINAKDNITGKKSIHIAAANGHTHIIDYYLKCGISIEDIDFERRTPLYYATWYDQVAAIDFLTLEEANIHAKNKFGSGFLHAAASADYVRVAECFLSRGLNVNECNYDNESPLHFSVLSNRLSVTKFLVEKGADIFLQDKKGKTPLDYAKEEGYSKIFNHLKYACIKSSPSLHIAAMKCDLKAIKFFISEDVNINTVDKKNYTPLHYAAGYGNLSVVNFLVSEGASVLTRSSQDTVLHLAVRSNTEEVVKVILSKISEQQDVNLVNADNSKGDTPLIWAAQRGNMNIIQMLLEHGADVHMKNNDGLTALHYAAEKGHYRVVEFLVGKECSVQVMDNERSQPIHYAATYGHTDVMKFLLDRGASVNSVSNFGTPLHCAAYAGNLKAVEFLLSRDANIHAVNIAGMQPLHCAIMCPTDVNGACNTGIVELLLKKGASANDIDAIGKTPLQYSVLESKLQLVELFIKKGANSFKDKYCKTPLDWAKDKKSSYLL